jgi:hypothetical protein
LVKKKDNSETMDTLLVVSCQMLKRGVIIDDDDDDDVDRSGETGKVLRVAVAAVIEGSDVALALALALALAPVLSTNTTPFIY